VQLNQWKAEFGHAVDFLCVYIKEAHANDIWPLGKHVDLPSHKTFEDRVASSDILLNKYKLEIPMMYDTMDDAFDKEFAVWPERYFIVIDYKMVVVFEPTLRFGFDRDHIHASLERIDKGDLPVLETQTSDSVS